MSAPCVGYLRSAKAPRRYRGTAVIMAILTVALMATLAASVVTNYGAKVMSLTGRHDQNQARWLARGAVDWARNVLSNDARTTATDHTGETWATKVPATPVDNGEVSGEVEDLSGRFDLNSVVTNGAADSGNRAAYVRLLKMSGVDDDTAFELADRLVAWIVRPNPDGAKTSLASTSSALQGLPQRPRQTPLVDVDELSLIEGYDAEVVANLSGMVAAFPSPAPLNLNTVSAEVLAALMPDLGITATRVIVADRQRAPFKDVNDFVARSRRSPYAPKTGLAVVSRYFLVSGRARYGDATTRMLVLLDRQNQWSEIIWQKIL
jgi:general secretion pathway protein K